MPTSPTDHLNPEISLAHCMKETVVVLKHPCTFLRLYQQFFIRQSKFSMFRKLGNFLRAIFIFYRSFWIPASLITIFCWFGIFSASLTQIKEHKEFYGILMFIGPFFWIKTATNFLILLYLIKYKANELYFYYNLGIGKAAIWITTFLIDYLTFFLAIFITGLILNQYFIPGK